MTGVWKRALDGSRQNVKKKLVKALESAYRTFRRLCIVMESESGEIGRRAGFRFLFPFWVYGFDSLLSHLAQRIASGFFCP